MNAGCQVKVQMSGVTSTYLRTCPHQGLNVDRDSIFIELAEVHRCYVVTRGQWIDLDHQGDFCLTSEFAGCPRYVTPPDPVSPSTVKQALPAPAVESGTTVVPEDADFGPPSRRPRPLEFLEDISVLKVIGLLIIALYSLRLSMVT